MCAVPLLLVVHFGGGKLTVLSALASPSILRRRTQAHFPNDVFDNVKRSVSKNAIQLRLEFDEWELDGALYGRVKRNAVAMSND